MNDSISFLGCAFSKLAVLFDMCFENHGIRKFQIYKNIPVDGEPAIIKNQNNYVYELFEPNSSFHGVPGEIAFGVTGPWGKFKVHPYFKNSHDVERDIYMNLVDYGSYNTSSSKLSKAVQIQQNVVASSQTTLGFGMCIKRGVSVEHHNNIKDYVEINSGVTISGNINLGRQIIIGMGSVVTTDVPEAVKSPCKVIMNNEKQLISGNK